MKKTFAILAGFCTAALCLEAQTTGNAAFTMPMDDVKSLVQGDYYGTARTIGMGNAVSALGGDLGTIVFNPAGSAVSSYSQISLTPGLSVNFNTAGMTNMDATGPSKVTSTRFVMPNFGVNIAINTTDDIFRRFSFGFSATNTHIYNDKLSARGSGRKSIAGSMAYNAEGYSGETLANYNTDYAICVGYKSGAINPDDILPPNTYSAITEDYDPATGVLAPSLTNHDYFRTNLGTKTDYMINMGADLGDFVYLGATLGFSDIRYNIDESLKETSIAGIIYDTNFSDLNYHYEYSCRGTGVYGKFGIIATPFDGLRLGAAIQTPTAVTVTEFFGHDMTTRWYDDSSRDRIQYGKASSPSGEWRYKVTLPFRYNFGLAYTLGSAVVVSADYERVNYKFTKYKPISRDDDFRDTNDQISGLREGRCMSASNMFRAGIEGRLFEWFSLRAGYNFATSGDGISRGNGFVTDIRNNTHAISAGLGFYTAGSFYSDIAFRYSWRESLYIDGLYDDYKTWAVNEADRIAVTAPGVEATRRLLTVVATIGWRF